MFGQTEKEREFTMLLRGLLTLTDNQKRMALLTFLTFASLC